MRRLIFVCTLVGALTGMPAATLAADTELNRQCYGTGNAPETIEACTGVIAGGFADRKDLGGAFKLRGSAYADIGDYDKAIDDYGHAIEINPGDADVFNERGASYAAKEQYARASTSTTAARSLSSRIAPWRWAIVASPRRQ